MKLSLFFLTVFLFAISSYSQDTLATKDFKEEENLPNNKTALIDLLEANREKKIVAEKKVSNLNNYLQFLNDYQNDIIQFQPGRLKKIFEDIESAISRKQTTEIVAQEGELNSYLEPLYSYFFSRPNNSDENPSSKAYLLKIENALSPLRQNKILSTIQSEIYRPSDPTSNLTLPKVQELKKIIDSSTISKVISQLKAIVSDEISLTKKTKEQAEKELRSLNSIRLKIYEKQTEQETQINGLAIKLGLPLFCATILLLFLVPGFKKKSDSQGESKPGSQNVLLEISTVLLLTMSILILGLSDKIKGDVLGTLIGGISGYVLNRINSRNDSQQQTP